MKVEFVKALRAALQGLQVHFKHHTQLNPNVACLSKPPAAKFRDETRMAIFHAVTLFKQ